MRRALISAALLALIGLLLSGFGRPMTAGFAGGGAGFAEPTDISTKSIILSSPWGDFTGHSDWDAAADSIYTPASRADFAFAVYYQDAPTAHGAHTSSAFISQRAANPANNGFSGAAQRNFGLYWSGLNTDIPNNVDILSAKLCGQRYTTAFDMAFADTTAVSSLIDGVYAVFDTCSTHSAWYGIGNGDGTSPYLSEACWNSQVIGSSSPWNDTSRYYYAAGDTTPTAYDDIWDYGIVSQVSHHGDTWSASEEFSIDVTREVQILKTKGLTCYGIWIFAVESPNSTYGIWIGSHASALDKSPFLVVEYRTVYEELPWDGNAVAWGFHTADIDSAINLRAKALYDSMGLKFDLATYRNQAATKLDSAGVYEFYEDGYGFANHSQWHGAANNGWPELGTSGLDAMSWFSSGNAASFDSCARYISPDSFAVQYGIPAATFGRVFVPPSGKITGTLERALRQNGFLGCYNSALDTKPDGPWGSAGISDQGTWFSWDDTVSIYRIYFGVTEVLLWGGDGAAYGKADVHEAFTSAVGQSMLRGGASGGCYMTTGVHDIIDGGNYSHGTNLTLLRWTHEIIDEMAAVGYMTPTRALNVYRGAHVAVTAPTWAANDIARSADADSALYWSLP